MLKRTHPTNDSWRHISLEPKTGRFKWNIHSVVILAPTNVKCQQHHQLVILCIFLLSVSSESSFTLYLNFFFPFISLSVNFISDNPTINLLFSIRMHNHFNFILKFFLNNSLLDCLPSLLRESGCNKEQRDGCICFFFPFYFFSFLKKNTDYYSSIRSRLCVFFFFYFAEPITSIVGEPEMFIDKDSTMNLTCVVRHSPEPPTAIYWTHDQEVLIYQYMHLWNVCMQIILCSFVYIMGRKRIKYYLIFDKHYNRNFNLEPKTRIHFRIGI